MRTRTLKGGIRPLNRDLVTFKRFFAFRLLFCNCLIISTKVRFLPRGSIAFLEKAEIVRF